MTTLLSILIHTLVLIVFVNRYIAGVIMRVVRGKNWDETTDDFEPTVTVVIPMFNEGAVIKETLQSMLDLDYPAHKLDVIVVDDRSSDDSFEQAMSVARTSGGRISVLRNRVNMGKRHSIIHAVRRSTAEIIVSADSDVVAEPASVRQLIRRFTMPSIAAVGGRVDVRNKQENWLTRMQVAKYHFSYFFMKNIEWAFRRVMCLSGCLTAYRRSVLIELEPVLLNREICGVPIKYGEDRFLTRQIVKAGWHTTMTLDAVCRTTVPNTLNGYFSQQLRWRRSNLIDYAGGMSHVWRLNPVLAIHFFSLFGLILVYPVSIVRSIAAGKFLPLIIAHLFIMATVGIYYRYRTRNLPKEERVGALALLPMTIIMPVIYALLTPVALFTLDSGSWETRIVPAGEVTAEEPLAKDDALLEKSAAAS